MPFLKPLKRASKPGLEDTFRETEGFLGFLPNDVLTMAHLPEATKAFMDFCFALYGNATLPPVLLHMVGMMASAGAGCNYCTAHTANKLFEESGDAAKVANMWSYASAPEFSDAERAALDFALSAGQSPSAVAPEHYVALSRHFSEKEIVEILFVICQFGFWNRWNDSVGTVLEDTPRQCSAQNLDPSRWKLGKHAA